MDMKSKIIFWGHVKEGDKVRLVSWDGETGSQYHRIHDTLIEYAVVATYEQLRDELITKRPVILCLEHEKELDWSVLGKKCQKVVYMPGMSRMTFHDAVCAALFSTQVYTKGMHMTLFAGKEESAEQIAIHILEHFQFAQKAKKLTLLIGSKEPMEIDQVSKIEDVVKEYAADDSKFRVEQVYLKRQKTGYSFLLHIQ